jgi:hypothetical protein
MDRGGASKAMWVLHALESNLSLHLVVDVVSMSSGTWISALESETRAH